MAEDGEALWAIIHSVADVNLVHYHVEHPTQAVLDTSVSADDAVEALGRKRCAENVVRALEAGPSRDLAGRGDLADSGKVRPVAVSLQSVDFGADGRRATWHWS